LPIPSTAISTRCVRCRRSRGAGRRRAAAARRRRCRRLRDGVGHPGSERRRLRSVPRPDGRVPDLDRRPLPRLAQAHLAQPLSTRDPSVRGRRGDGGRRPVAVAAPAGHRRSRHIGTANDHRRQQLVDLPRGFLSTPTGTAAASPTPSTAKSTSSASRTSALRRLDRDHLEQHERPRCVRSGRCRRAGRRRWGVATGRRRWCDRLPDGVSASVRCRPGPMSAFEQCLQRG
jgi:hypothetical protein